MRIILMKFFLLWFLILSVQLSTAAENPLDKQFSKFSKRVIPESERKDDYITINSQCTGDYCDFSETVREYLLKTAMFKADNFDEKLLIDAVKNNLKEAAFSLYQLRTRSGIKSEALNALYRAALNGSFKAQELLAKLVWNEPKGLVFKSLSGKIEATVWARLNHKRSVENRRLFQQYRKKISKKDYKRTQKFVYALRSEIASNIIKNITLRRSYNDSLKAKLSQFTTEVGTVLINKEVTTNVSEQSNLIGKWSYSNKEILVKFSSDHSFSADVLGATAKGLWKQTGTEGKITATSKMISTGQEMNWTFTLIDSDTLSGNFDDISITLIKIH